MVIAVSATSNKIVYFDYSTIDFDYKILNYFVSATYFEIIRLQQSCELQLINTVKIALMLQHCWKIALLYLIFLFFVHHGRKIVPVLYIICPQGRKITPSHSLRKNRSILFLHFACKDRLRHLRLRTFVFHLHNFLHLLHTFYFDCIVFVHKAFHALHVFKWKSGFMLLHKLIYCIAHGMI